MRDFEGPKTALKDPESWCGVGCCQEELLELKH